MILMTEKRFFIKIENEDFQLYDREEEFSFNKCEDEFLAMQVVDALNYLEHEREYKPLLFKNETDGKLYKFYQRVDYE